MRETVCGTVFTRVADRIRGVRKRLRAAGSSQRREKKKNRPPARSISPGKSRTDAQLLSSSFVTRVRRFVQVNNRTDTAHTRSAAAISGDAPPRRCSRRRARFGIPYYPSRSPPGTIRRGDSSRSVPERKISRTSLSRDDAGVSPKTRPHEIRCALQTKELEPCANV